jgi:hypothetical protein
MQAITTHALPATGHRGACLRARCAAATLLVPWDHAMGGPLSETTGQHLAAARAMVTQLVAKHGAEVWGGTWVGACMYSDDYCWVRATPTTPEDLHFTV